MKVDETSLLNLKRKLHDKATEFHGVLSGFWSSGGRIENQLDGETRQSFVDVMNTIRTADAKLDQDIAEIDNLIEELQELIKKYNGIKF